MTVEIPNIKSIAIIGAGPGGLASLYEFLHTNKDGTSTIRDPKSHTAPSPGNYPKAADPAFDKIVVFEQKDHPGGIWAPATLEADLPVPPQEILDAENYNDPRYVRPRNEVPEGVKGATVDKPFVTKGEPNTKSGNFKVRKQAEVSENEVNKSEGEQLIDELQWKRTGIFPFLFTNIPQRFTRFSYLPDEEEFHNKQRKIYPFLTHQELSQKFTDFVEQENLLEYIRLNSAVENVAKDKDTGKWIITVRHPQQNGDNLWYQEEFDAVVVSNGHYTVPYFPHINGLAEYNANFPNQLIHAKSFRNLEDFKDKDVLVVGGSISTANLLQYIVPVAKSVTNSKRGKHLVFAYINDALVSKGIDPRPEISYIDPKSGVFYFTDGTLGKYDKVLFTTGYHYHFPFFNPQDNYLSLVNPGNLSRVGGLYLHTIDQKDPTLGTVGIIVSHLNFHTIEASAAALAGVWSGASSLPNVDPEQKKWEDDLVNTRGNSLFFHFYDNHGAKEIIDDLEQYFAKGRYNPLIRDGEFVDEIDKGSDYLEKLFYGLKDKTIAIEETNDWKNETGKGEITKTEKSTKQDSEIPLLQKGVAGISVAEVPTTVPA